VNTEWDKSFARVDSSRKAILKRGWNPLNYVLLDHPDLIQTNSVETEEVVHPTNSSTSTNISSTTTLPNAIVQGLTGSTCTALNSTIMVNKNGQRSSNYLTHLLAQEKRDEGQKRKFEDQKRGRNHKSKN
jgi:hypothetical protein